MNELIWKTFTTDKMGYDTLRYLRGPRKRRLYGCACCRRVWHLLTDEHERSRSGIEVAEWFADNLTKKAPAKAALLESKRATRAVEQSGKWEGQSGEWWAAAAVECVLTQNQIDCCLPAPGRIREAVKRVSPGLEKDEAVWQGNALRDIFGNPFRPVVFDPRWRSDNAVSLARTMYESRDFSAMPILADALQDMGCEDADILTHCRDPKGTHVRGCWVVDLLLGKA